jgi:type IV pilus assembly protein PilA
MFLQNLRAKVGARLNGDSEAGFTLIELLVVMLILGILAAIALPAFFNQKSKANDAKAKETAHSVQVAMETCGTDNNGEYSEANCQQANLNNIEKTIPATTATEGEKVEATPEGTGYTIVITAAGSANTFEIKSTAGAIEFKCATEETGGCPSGGEWNK